MAGRSHIHKVIKSCWNFQDKQIPFQGLPLFYENSSRTFSVIWNSRTFQGWPWIQGRRRNPATPGQMYLLNILYWTELYIAT